MNKISIKKCLLSLLFFIISFSHSKELPFIGSISYSPSGGSASVFIFKINKDGNLLIKGCGTTSCSEIYNSEFKPLILIDSEYEEYAYGFLFEGDYVYYTDGKGNKIKANIEDCYSAFMFSNTDIDEFCMFNVDLAQSSEEP